MAVTAQAGRLGVNLMNNQSVSDRLDKFSNKIAMMAASKLRSNNAAPL